jgi:hypothetical protein
LVEQGKLSRSADHAFGDCCMVKFIGLVRHVVSPEDRADLQRDALRGLRARCIWSTIGALSMELARGGCSPRAGECRSYLHGRRVLEALW